MVVRRKKDVALEILQAVVDRGDGFQVQVVGGLVENQYIGAEEHHPRKHAPHLFPAGEDLHGLKDIVPREKHPA